MARAGPTGHISERLTLERFNRRVFACHWGRPVRAESHAFSSLEPRCRYLVRSISGMCNGSPDVPDIMQRQEIIIFWCSLVSGTGLPVTCSTPLNITYAIGKLAASQPTTLA